MKYKHREWLIKLREKKNLSQEQLALICETAQVTISAIEVGNRRPSVELSKKIAKVLDFDWTKFYTEKKVKLKSLQKEPTIKKEREEI